MLIIIIRFECHVCHKRFGRYQLMDSHIKSKHLGVEQVWCPQCGFRPKNAREFKVRLQLLNKVEQFRRVSYAAQVFLKQG